MEVETLKYSPKNGWNIPSFPKLDSKNTALILFGASDSIKILPAIEELKENYPQAKIIGCSTAGEIFGEEIFDDNLSVAVIKFTDTNIATATATVNTALDSYQAGEKLRKSLTAPGLKGIIVFSDGVNVNGSDLVEGLVTGLDESVIVTGGLAGDGANFKNTWVVHDSAKPQHNMIAAMGFYGDKIKLSFGSKGGWDIFGTERTITKSKNNIVYEIDGQPALTLYKKYLGERACELPAAALLFPLAIRRVGNDSEQIVRTILSVNEAEQSMTFAGDIPEKSLAQLMKANFDRLVDGAADAAHQASQIFNDNIVDDVFVIAVSCVGRRIVLGERAEEEIQATLDKFPKGTKQIGFYSYGEIAPTNLSSCDLHNQTMTLTTISEQK